MGLKGVYGQPFLNLDSYLEIDQFNSLFTEMAVGISKSWIDKGVVSCGTRPNETKLELCRVLERPDQYLTPDQVQTLASLTTLHQKAWYCSLILPVHHPYSLVFIRREKNFWKKQYAQDCEWTENAKYFPKTLEFLKTLPFEEIGRVLFFITEPSQETLIHYDGGHEESRKNSNTEMIYFRPQKKKKLFIWDEDTNTQHPLNSTASFWNDLDWHGALPAEGKTFSFRVDGIFKEEFRKTLQQEAKKSNLNKAD